MSAVPLSLLRRPRRRLDLPLRTTLALWWLAVKRSGGPLLLLAIAGAMAWLIWDGWTPGLVLWARTSQRIAFSVVIVGPLVTAFACWAAGQSRRRRVNDLLDSTALPAPYATAASVAGVIAWGLASFFACAGVAMLWTATRATWGGPDWGLITVAAGAIVVCGLVGALAGRLSASRVLPALMALGGVAFIAAPVGLGIVRIEMFSPLAVIYEMTRTWFYEVDDAIVSAHLRWLAALGGTLAVAVVFWPVRGWLPRGLLVAGAALTVVTAMPLYGWRAPEVMPAEQRLIAYEPTCATGTVTVCVHPAFESLLNEAAPLVEALIQPIAGLEGVPTRFEQRMAFGTRETAVGWFSLDDAASLNAQISRGLTTDLVVWPESTTPEVSGDAQFVVAEWLVRRVYDERSGVVADSMFDVSPAFNRLWICDEVQCALDEAAYASERQEFDAVVARFAALDPEVRRTWLEANWADLRAGRLHVEDLP